MMKKITLKACAVTIIGLSTFKAFADSTWHYAKVNLIGTTSAGRFAQLTEIDGEPLFQDRFFKMAPGIENEAMAVFLTAVSAGKQVYIRTNITELTATDMPQIDMAYMTPRDVPLD